ncbi:hypothetical protein J2S05_002627 [Alkalicoccobacillus murimartini]|uniref:Uncharacterized protein n=1 Tax=Alkalicoccobacillus murimartini TaxID=171685 RepID=A0ABT9YJY1_9BACI|nr:hypothetical protein [Alkalicoccobacillus murimartini]
MQLLKKLILKFLFIYITYIGVRLLMGLFFSSTSPDPLYADALIFTTVFLTLSSLFSSSHKSEDTENPR